MMIAYVSDSYVLSNLMKNGGRMLSDSRDENGEHIYAVDVTKVRPALFVNGQILKCFSCERPVMTF